MLTLLPEKSVRAWSRTLFQLFESTEIDDLLRQIFDFVKHLDCKVRTTFAAELLNLRNPSLLRHAAYDKNFSVHFDAVGCPFATLLSAVNIAKMRSPPLYASPSVFVFKNPTTGILVRLPGILQAIPTALFHTGHTSEERHSDRACKEARR
jgi:hypothetical protein